MNKGKLNMLFLIAIGIILLISITIVTVRVIITNNSSTDKVNDITISDVKNEVIEKEIEEKNEILKDENKSDDNKNLENAGNIFNNYRMIDFIDKEPIVEINDQIKMKPSCLIMQESGTTFWMRIHLEGQELKAEFPLKCKVYDSNNNLLYKSEDVGNLQKDHSQGTFYGSEFGEECKLENYKKENEKIVFELYNNKDVLLGKADIETFFEDFKYESDEKMESISEIDLKNFLDAVSLLKNSEDKEQERLMYITLFLNINAIGIEEFEWEESGGTHYGYSVDDIKNIIKSFYKDPEGMKIFNEDIYEILEKNGKKYYVEISPGCLPNCASVIDIKDIKYSDGKYKIIYTYWYAGEESVFDYNPDYSQCQKYERTIELIKNEEGALTPYKVLSIDTPKELYK